MRMKDYFKIGKFVQYKTWERNSAKPRVELTTNKS